MIAVVVPAHNEEAHLQACLASVVRAGSCPHLGGEPVVVIVVIDACCDRSRELALEAGAHVVDASVRNVGKARAMGADVALSMGARWLAFTDADSEVDSRWLSAQLGLCAEAVCGTVSVRDWAGCSPAVKQRFHADYTDNDGHRHIHGANLGVSAAAYRNAGGFRSLTSSEDVALVTELLRRGIHVAWSAAPRVYTSVRKNFRAPAGFGAYLLQLESEAASDLAEATA